jgi:hypothetical protein
VGLWSAVLLFVPREDYHWRGALLRPPRLGGDRSGTALQSRRH